MIKLLLYQKPAFVIKSSIREETDIIKLSKLLELYYF